MTTTHETCEDRGYRCCELMPDPFTVESVDLPENYIYNGWYDEHVANYRKLTPIPRTYQSAAEARDAAIDFQHWQSEQSLSYGELYEWQCHWESVLKQFPELADEFRENGII